MAISEMLNRMKPLSKQKVHCPLGCLLPPQLPSNLRRHLKRVHWCSPDDIQRFNLRLLYMKSTNMSNNIHKCDICNRYFGSLSGVKEHMRLIHKDKTLTVNAVNNNAKDQTMFSLIEEEFETLTTTKLERIDCGTQRNTAENVTLQLCCPNQNCQYTCTSRKELCLHFNEVHRSIEIVEVAFETELEFEAWFEEKQRSTLTVFSTRNSRSDGKTDDIYMICRNEGNYKVKGEQRMSVSKRLTGDQCCLAFLHIRKTEKFIKCTGCFDHTHPVKCSRLNLLSTEIQRIQELMADGFSNIQLMRKFEREYSPNHRLHYLTLDDLRNIRAKSGLIEGYFHKFDLESLKIRVDKQKQEDGLIYFQYPKDDTGKEFILVMMTPEQQKLMEKYSQRGISIDDTHNVTKYNLKLTTVIVLNGYDRGIPICYMLSSSTTSVEVAVMFRCIQEKYSDFHPEYFISDEANCFFNGYQEEDDSNSVMCEMRELLYEMNKAEVQKRITKILHYLNTMKTTGSLKVYEYLNGRYFCKLEQWSSIHREASPFMTSMFSESFHATLKKTILNGNMNIRVDFLVVKLMESFCYIVVKNAKAIERNLATAVPRRRLSTQNCRVASGKCDEYKIEEIGRKEILISKIHENKTYKLFDRYECTCDQKENVHCSSCGVCPYRWVCSCKYQKSGVSCIHIHLMMKKMGRNCPNENSVNANDETNLTHNNITVTENDSGEMSSGEMSCSSSNQVQEDLKQHHLDEIVNMCSILTRTLRLNKGEIETAVYENCNDILKRLIDDHFPADRLKLPYRNNLQISSARTCMNFQMKKRGKRNEKRTVYGRIEMPFSAVDVCGLCRLADPPGFTGSMIDWHKCPSCDLPVHSFCTRKTKICGGCEEQFIPYTIEEDSDITE